MDLAGKGRKGRQALGLDATGEKARHDAGEHVAGAGRGKAGGARLGQQGNLDAHAGSRRALGNDDELAAALGPHDAARGLESALSVVGAES